MTESENWNKYVEIFGTYHAETMMSIINSWYRLKTLQTALSDVFNEYNIGGSLNAEEAMEKILTAYENSLTSLDYYSFRTYHGYTESMNR